MSIEYIHTNARPYRARRNHHIGWEEGILKDDKRCLSLFVDGKEAVLTENDAIKLIYVLTGFLLKEHE